MVCLVNCGGKEIEKYELEGGCVSHINSPSYDTLGSMGMDATEVWIALEDREKGILFHSQKDKLYSIPMLEYEKVKNSYLCKLYHSVSESDDTGNVLWRGKNEILYSIIEYSPKQTNLNELTKSLSRSLIAASGRANVKK